MIEGVSVPDGHLLCELLIVGEHFFPEFIQVLDPVAHDISFQRRWPIADRLTSREFSHGVALS